MHCPFLRVQIAPRVFQVTAPPTERKGRMTAAQTYRSQMLPIALGIDVDFSHFGCGIYIALTGSARPLSRAREWVIPWRIDREGAPQAVFGP